MNKTCMQCGKLKPQVFSMLETHKDGTTERSYFCDKKCLFSYIDDFKEEEKE